MVLSTRARGEERIAERRGKTGGIDMLWQSPSTPTYFLPLYRHYHCHYHRHLHAATTIPKPLFGGAPSALQPPNDSPPRLRTLPPAGVVYWSPLATPSTPLHHAYAPLLSSGTRTRWCSRVHDIHHLPCIDLHDYEIQPPAICTTCAGNWSNPMLRQKRLLSTHTPSPAQCLETANSGSEEIVIFLLFYCAIFIFPQLFETNESERG